MIAEFYRCFHNPTTSKLFIKRISQLLFLLNEQIQTIMKMKIQTFFWTYYGAMPDGVNEK